MTPTLSAYGPTDCIDAWLGIVLDDPGRADDYSPARSAIFDAVRVDHTGRVALQLFDLTADQRSDVRAAAVLLLSELSMFVDPWDAATDLAQALLLRDTEDRVRRSAAWLLANANHDAALALATDAAVSLDPVARLAVVEAVFGRWGPERDELRLITARRLCDDYDPAVRVRAGLEMISVTPPSRRRFAESVVLSALAVGGKRLGGPGSLQRQRPGELWGTALARQAREDACYRWIARLVGQPDEAARSAGIDLAHTAMRTWRAAPGRAAPLLRTLLEDCGPTLRRAAARTLGASLESSRAVADELAARRTDPDPEVQTIAVLALARIGDARSTAGISALLRSGSTERAVHEAVTAIVRATADPSPLVEAARGVLDQTHDTCSPTEPHTGQCSLSAAITTLVLTGPHGANAVPLLVTHLSALREDTDDVHRWIQRRLMAALGAIGPHAAAAIPLLERFVGADPDTPAVREAQFALVRITGDRGRAETYLDACRQGRRSDPAATRLLDWLADNGGLAPRHAALLHDMASRGPSTYPGAVAALWRYAGARAADRVLATLPGYLDDDVHGPSAADVLGGMGALARPALPVLDALIDRPTRLPLYIGDRDVEMRADEAIATAAAAARSRIAG